MNHRIAPFFILLFSCSCVQAIAQNNSSNTSNKVWVDSALFSPKLFVENKGQFDNAPYLSSGHVFFAVKQGEQKIFFEKNKIEYTLHKKVKNEKIFKEFQREESKKHNSGMDSEEEIKEEEEMQSKVFKTLTKVINMEWIGANKDCEIKAEEISEQYFNYGMDNNIKHDINFVPGYKKIVYKNLYDGIDVEYTFHPQTGIKYNIIVHPGADITKIKLKYSGADDVLLDNENVIIKTELGNIIDHAPVSFQNKNGSKIKTKFLLQNNTLSFQIAKYDTSKILTIDPWLSSTLPSLDTAYEIAVDPAGNVWVYGDYNSEIKKYNNAGVAQWTFTSGPGYLYNASLIGGDLAVDPTGNSYCSGSECVRKLSPAGASLWLYAPSRNITNISCCETGWRMVFDAANNRLYGGGSNGQTKATWYDPATGNPEWLPNGWNACNIISGPCPSACPNSNGEIRHITLAPNGNFYAYTCVGDGFSSNDVSTITGFDPNFVGIYRDCNVPSSPYWIGGTYYNGCYYMGNGIAASNCFIYIYTGSEVYKYDIFNPNQLGSSIITNGVHLMNSGILADVCNNFYVGTQSGISAYDQNFNLLATAATPKPVFDMAFAPGNNIAACGIGFVGMFANVQQVCAPVVCTPPVNLPMSGSSAFTPMTGCNSNDGTGSVINIINGNGPYTYQWSNGGTTSSISGLAAGTYTCLITDSSCPQETFTISITIPPSSGPSASLTSTNILCFGGNASSTVTATGGNSPYTYLWTPSGQTNATATNLAAGNYTVVVTDANGCSTQQTITITQPTQISVTIPPSNVSCNGGNNGTATANASGGTSPYTYLWSNAQTTMIATNLSAATYTVIVTDANGCTRQQTITITQPTPISGSTTVVNTQCSSSSGTATASASGGNGPYTYVWSNSQSGVTASNLSSGTYTVTITDANGCTTTATAIINNSNGPTVTTNSTGTILCNGGNNASANATATGGTAPYTYSWNNSQTTPSISNLGAGTYTVYVTDANGCSSQQTITITQPTILALTLSQAADTCNSTNGSANATVNGGTAPYTYLWSNGATTQNITNISGGSYSVIITDANGCTTTQTVFVSSVGSATANAGIDVLITQGNSIQLNASGGGTYSWVPPTGLSCTNCANPVANPTSTTTYVVYVTNSNGCSDSDTITVFVDIPCVGSLMTALFPNAFSPNHDGENERLCVPPNTCIVQFHLKVFDRWGEMVFESEDLRTCWDGTYKGKELNTGVFVFFFEAVMTNGDKFNQQGNISLIK